MHDLFSPRVQAPGRFGDDVEEDRADGESKREDEGAQRDDERVDTDRDVNQAAGR